MIASGRWALSSCFFVRPRKTVLARYAGICLLLSLLPGCLTDEATIGVVDGPAIVQDAAPGRKAVAHMAQVREVLQGNLNAVVAKLESYPDQGQAQEILQQAQASLQQTLNAHESQINAQLTEILQASVRECRDAKKLSMVIGKSTLLDYDPALNVSGDVLVLFDKKTIQLPLMPAAVADPALPAPHKPVVVQPAVPAVPVVEEKVKPPVVPAVKPAAVRKAEPKAETRRRTQKNGEKRRN